MIRLVILSDLLIVPFVAYNPRILAELKVVWSLLVILLYVEQHILLVLSEPLYLLVHLEAGQQVIG